MAASRECRPRRAAPWSVAGGELVSGPRTQQSSFLLFSRRRFSFCSSKKLIRLTKSSNFSGSCSVAACWHNFCHSTRISPSMARSRTSRKLMYSTAEPQVEGTAGESPSARGNDSQTQTPANAGMFRAAGEFILIIVEVLGMGRQKQQTWYNQKSSERI